MGKDLKKIYSRKFDTKDGLLEEILYCLNQVPNTKVKSNWFKNTYEICSEIQKHINNGR